MTDLMPEINSQDWFNELIEKANSIAVEAVFASRIELLRGKWSLGKLIVENNENFERAKIYGKGIAKKLAQQLKCSEREVERWIQFYKKYEAEDFDRAVGMLPEGKNISWNKIKTQYLPQPKEEKSESEDWQYFNWQFYNVWPVFKLGGCYGKDYPGKTPHQMVANLLKYFTKEGDLVVDPMAGGGTALDVAIDLNRKCRAFDVKPARKDIEKNDILEGLPIKNADFIFLDPPYYSVKNEYYVSSLFTESLKGFYEAMEIAFKNCHRALKDKGRLALLMKPGVIRRKDHCDWYDLTLESYIIAKAVGFKLIERISSPYSTCIYDGYDVARAKKKNYMLNTLRDVLVFEKQTMENK